MKDADATIMATAFAKTIARIAEFAVDLAETLHKDLGLEYQGPSANKKGQQKKRARLERDPNEPKRPLTAYMIYSTHARDELKKRGEPQAQMKDIAEMWNKLDDSEKEKFNADALHQKEIYDKQMLEYKSAKNGTKDEAGKSASEMSNSEVDDVPPPKMSHH